MQRGGGRRFLLAALHSVAKRVSRGQAHHPTRAVPVCPETAPHASAATIRSSARCCRAIALCPRGWKRSQDSVLWFLLSLGSRALFSQQRQWGRPALASTRGPCGAGGRAFRGLCRSAPAWGAGRRKPLRGAALHLSAPHCAVVKARRLPTSGRREIPSGNSRSARDLEVAKRVSRGQAPHPTSPVPVCPEDRTAPRLRHRNPPAPSPFASKSGMSPFLHHITARIAADMENCARFPTASLC